ncbi:PhlG protein [Colletotrichum scovillei]|uniref:PhlG protein n=1 Tax=Colletotrichum scovillei TaxID=1209932 RepID=UPI0015C30C06|nr:PhlG protein [Colletotrichum scovillei]KAF4774077.1 PhlG protein [Colletotrichum scovillei]
MESGSGSLRQRSAARIAALRGQLVTGTVPSRNDTQTPSTTATATNQSHNPDKDGYPEKIPLTYYPLETQKAFTYNENRMKSKLYAKYCNKDLYLYADIPQYKSNPPLPGTPLFLAPTKTRKSTTTQCPPPTSFYHNIFNSIEGILPITESRRLLEPGYHAHENGWRSLPDGTAYVTSRTRFPGSTGDMVRWWFWWHSVEPERYALWFPYDHLAARSTYADRLHRTDLSHTQKWLGSTHRVTEFIGATKMTVNIHFVDPAQYGLPWEELKAAGYEAAVCAELRDGLVSNLKIGDFLHLWRKTEDGLELRIMGMKVGIDYLAGALGFKHRMAGDNIAYEHFIHDQTEFTNLASFLPGLYADYMDGKL